ncbi:MAG: hypothetical protein K2X69_09420 [Silvanigrellaceae bacterium]|nr:hypothetical protein [Silvanigrellaceae bacterium]
MNKKFVTHSTVCFVESKCLIFLFFSFFLISCTYNIQESDPNEKQNLANSVRRSAAFKIKEEKSLIPCGTGGQMMNDIQMLALSFFYYTPLTMEKARELVIYAAQKLANEINNEPKIHPHLYQYPFSPTHTEIYIFVQNKKNSKIPADYISVVSLSRGIVEYDIKDPQTRRLITIHRETYQEALEKLSSLQAEVPQTSTL